MSLGVSLLPFSVPFILIVFFSSLVSLGSHSVVVLAARLWCKATQYAIIEVIGLLELIVEVARNV